MSLITNVFEPKLENPFWDFSIDAYRQAGVESICLQLQDLHSLNVNFVLYCCWLGKQSMQVSSAEMSLLVKELRLWDSDVVAPLREVRRSLDTIKEEAASLLRTEVLNCEVQAEKLFQGQIYRFAQVMIEKKIQGELDTVVEDKPLTLENIHNKRDLSGVRPMEHRDVEFRRFTEYASYNLGQYCDAIGRTKTVGLKKTVTTLVGLLDD
ncbi:MAG: TIGR02444 family protein [Gammaproteobacteria bacterium]|nr:MAG: TIGR02444 family protein [Gammaproteobacteria bacterium]